MPSSASTSIYRNDIVALWSSAQATTPEDRRWAQSVLTLLVGKVVGYKFKR